MVFNMLNNNAKPEENSSSGIWHGFFVHCSLFLPGFTHPS